MCNGARCYTTSVFVCTSLDVWLWNSFYEGIIKCTLGLHWCFTTSGPQTACPSQYIYIYIYIYIHTHTHTHTHTQVHKLLYYIMYFYDKWKSTVVIKLEDVLFSVVTRSGIGCWYLFRSEVFSFLSPPSPCCIPVLLYCRCQTNWFISHCAVLLNYGHCIWMIISLILIPHKSIFVLQICFDVQIILWIVGRYLFYLFEIARVSCVIPLV
jgi:hypothetical protein